jgi:hypothetical protein
MLGLSAVRLVLGGDRAAGRPRIRLESDVATVGSRECLEFGRQTWRLSDSRGVGIRPRSRQDISEGRMGIVGFWWCCRNSSSRFPDEPLAKRRVGAFPRRRILPHLGRLLIDSSHLLSFILLLQCTLRWLSTPVARGYSSFSSRDRKNKITNNGQREKRPSSHQGVALYAAVPTGWEYHQGH